MSWSNMDGALAYLHFASIMLLTAFLVSELYLCTPRLRLEQVPTLARLDLFYLIAAIAALASGTLRVFVTGKGAAFYLGNPVFYIKLAVFLAIGLVSISPTVQFLRWRRALDAGEQPVLQTDDLRTARRYIWLELALLAFVPLMAVLMARGTGLQR